MVALGLSPPSRGHNNPPRGRIDQPVRPVAVQNGATTTSDAGNARFNPESGIPVTQTGFDPTKQQFAPGAGISNAAGRRRSRHLGLDWRGRCLRNSTARTDQMKAELAQLQANGGWFRASMCVFCRQNRRQRPLLRSSSGKRMLTGWPMIWQPAAAMRAATPGFTAERRAWRYRR